MTVDLVLAFALAVLGPASVEDSVGVWVDETDVVVVSLPPTGESSIAFERD